MAGPEEMEEGEVRGPAEGRLFIVGGGEMAHLVPSFLTLGGGPSRCSLVIVPTAHDDETLAQEGIERLLAQPWMDGGLPAASISMLHTRDRTQADDEAFTAALGEASAVWFDGGRQWRYIDAYKGTRVEQELRAVLQRGGVVGGSSAGATVLGSFLTRGDTASNQLMVGDHMEGLGLLSNVAIDQHLLRRNRQFDLLEVLEAQPSLLGLGIDEGTALVVGAERADVIGSSYVAVYNSAQFWEAQGEEAATRDGEERPPFFLMHPGQALDLVTRLPVGGENADEIEPQLMSAILSEPVLVEAMRSAGAQMFVRQLQSEPQRTIEAYREQEGAMALLKALSAAIERQASAEGGPRL